MHPYCSPLSIHCMRGLDALMLDVGVWTHCLPQSLDVYADERRYQPSPFFGAFQLEYSDSALSRAFGTHYFSVSLSNSFCLLVTVQCVCVGRGGEGWGECRDCWRDDADNKLHLDMTNLEVAKNGLPCRPTLWEVLAECECVCVGAHARFVCVLFHPGIHRPKWTPTNQSAKAHPGVSSREQEMCQHDGV